MKNMYSLFLAIALSIAILPATAQNLLQNPGFESWSSDTQPDGFNIAENITKESTIVRSESFSAKHTSASSTKKIQQVIEGIEPGVDYTLQFYYYDNDDAAKMRIWSYWLNGTSTIPDDEAILRPGTYSENSGNWQEFTATITAPAQATAFRFELRVYNQDGNNGGAVYYDDLLFTGDVTVKPEPSNYPTNFTAQAQGMGGKLEWTDATGEQLPDGYLFLASMGIPFKASGFPIDGTPVANNLDISLGYISWNVPFGQEMHVFNTLEPAVIYFFEVFPYTNSGENIDYKTDGTPPYSVLIANNYEILLHETFDASLGVMNQYNVTGEQIWEYYNFNNEDYARMSGYSGGALPNEDWLISPAISWNILTTDITLNFRSARNYAGDALRLLISQDYNGNGNPNDFSWTDITDDAAWSEGSWTWVQSGDVLLMESGTPPLFIAFKYTSNSTEAATWQVDDVIVYGFTTVGTSEIISKASLHVYPNPSSGMIHFTLENSATMRVMDLQGKTITTIALEAGQQQLQLSHLPAGMYILHTQLSNGTTSHTKLLIE